jgi:hypothetical protein
MTAHRSSLADLEARLHAPTDARVHDVLLGGALNFAADRAVAAALLTELADARSLARDARAFLRRAVNAALDDGLDQFLDLGTGMPSVGDVHSLTSGRGHPVRLVLADHDAVVVHAWELTLDDRRATVDEAAAVVADLRNVPALLARVRTTGLFDLERPVCLLLTNVLDRLSDRDRPAQILAALRDALPRGSWVVVSHLSSGHARPADRATADRYRAAHTRLLCPLVDRSPDEVAALLDGWDLLDPGVAPVYAWRPDRLYDVDTARDLAVAAVGVRV